MLLAAFVWGERVRTGDGVMAVLLAVLAGAAAMIAAPGLDRHKPWLNYEALAGKLGPGHVDTFDWTQRYGPLHWPRTGDEVLDVQAKSRRLLEGREPRLVHRARLGPGQLPDRRPDRHH